MTTPTTKRDSAIQLAQLNYRVFPLPPKQKAPPPERFYDVATTDVNMVNRWWTNPVTGESTDHNIGIATGDDLMVVDVDDVNADLPPDLFPTTQLVRTPSGGHHRYYEVDEGVANSASKIGKGIDVRGHHGYVVGPGSETEKGVYAWANDAGETKAPHQLIRLAGTPGARAGYATGVTTGYATDLEADVERAVNWLKGAKPAIEGEGGERVTLETAYRVRDYGVSKDMCVELMFEHWNDRCEPPWDMDGLRLKTENAYKYAQNKFGVSSLAEFEAVPEEEVVDRRLPPTRPAAVYETTIDAAADKWDEEGVDPLVNGMLVRRTISCVYGESNIGKSFVAKDIAYHVAAGKPWQGREVSQGVVVYIAAEGGPGINKRCAALIKHYGWRGAPMRIIPCPVDLLSPGGDLKTVIDMIGQGVTLIVIDTLSRALAGGDENSPVDMGAFIKNIDRIRTASDAHIMIVHHSGKDKAKGMRGWSGLRAAIDTEIEITKGVIEITKQRDLEFAAKMGFALRVVPLGADKKGRPVTSCVIEITTASEFKRPALTPQESEIFDVIEAEVATLARDAGVATGEFEFENAQIYLWVDNKKPNYLRSVMARLKEKNIVIKQENGAWKLCATDRGATKVQQG